MAVWRDAGVAWLAAVGARQCEPLKLVLARSPWWWLAGISSFGDGGFNKRGGGSDLCRYVLLGGHGGSVEARSCGSEGLRWPVFGVVRWLVLGSAAEGWMVCRWKIWRCRCWIWRRGWPRLARSSIKIPSVAAGGSRLQPCRLSLPLVLWYPVFFFVGNDAAEFGWQEWVVICGVLQLLVAWSLVDLGLYGVRALRRLYLCSL